MAHKRVVVSWMIRLVILLYQLARIDHHGNYTAWGVYIYIHFVVVLLMKIGEFLRIITSIARNPVRNNASRKGTK